MSTEINQTNPPTYREQQHHRYQQALAAGAEQAALEAVWRAASEANLLQPEEESRDRLTVPRALHLITRLGWER